MVSAPLPPRIIEKCLTSDQIVIDTVVSKYSDHQPLYRQSAMLERDSGVELSRTTLDGWVLKVGELLIPMVSAMRQELLRGSCIQADGTLQCGWKPSPFKSESRIFFSSLLCVAFHKFVA